MMVQWEEGQDLKVSAESHLVGDNKQSFEKRSTRALRASGSWWQHVAMKFTIQAHFSEY